LHYGEIFTLGLANIQHLKGTEDRHADPSARAWPISISTQYARARTRASWGLGMKSDTWVERFVAARLAEHDERIRLRRASKAARGAKRDTVKLTRQRATEERARLRELRKKACGARTRAGHPCRRKGLGKGGRCPNHGGMSTGPRTPEGRARLSALLKARWALSHSSALQEAKSKVEKNRNASSRVVARSPTAKHGGG
jgi:hypothetical protein